MNLLKRNMKKNQKKILKKEDEDEEGKVKLEKPE